jgi:hypothetical protein
MEIKNKIEFYKLDKINKFFKNFNIDSFKDNKDKNNLDNLLNFIKDSLKKVDKEKTDYIKSKLYLSDLLDPLSRVTYLVEKGKIISYLKELFIMLKNSKLDSKLFINMVSETNMPQIGSVSYFIKSLGSVIGSFKGVINGIAEINAGVNTDDKAYKYVGILDLISSVGGVSILLGVPFAGLIYSTFFAILKGIVIFKYSSNFTEIQKADYVFSLIGNILNYSLYTGLFMPYSLIFMLIISVLQLTYLNSHKFRKFLSKIISVIKK